MLELGGGGTGEAVVSRHFAPLHLKQHCNPEFAFPPLLHYICIVSVTHHFPLEKYLLYQYSRAYSINFFASISLALAVVCLVTLNEHGVFQTRKIILSDIVGLSCRDITYKQHIVD
jgi:hypothetical protein